MPNQMDINILRQFYRGFSIEQPLGNNSFSYPHRKQKSLFVPPLVEASIHDLKPGKEIVFSEIQDGHEMNCPGLKNFIYIRQNNKDIFIFDNHNHAFFFWMAGLKEGKFKIPVTLVHIDEHADMREPEVTISVDLNNIDLKNVFDYTNFLLNVGNFIKPALAMSLFDRVEIINSQHGFEKMIEGNYILDIDIDIFSDKMKYIREDFKLDKIRQYVKGANFITIATSPYFIDQNRAIDLVKKILD